MDAIVVMNRDNVKNVQQQVETRLAPLMEELGLNFSILGGKYNAIAGTYEARVKFQCKNTETGADQARVNFDRLCGTIGLTPSDYHREVQWAGKWYRVIGLHLASEAYPVRVERIPDGREFRLPARAVINAKGA